MTNWFKRNASTILTCLSALGFMGTVVLAVRDTPKAMRALTDAKAEKRSTRLTKLEIVKTVAPAYAPATVVGAATLICMFGTNILNRKQQASLVSAYATLDQVFESYRKKVVLFGGKELDNAAKEAIDDERREKGENRPPWDEKQVFYMDGYPGFFERTMEEVRSAEYLLNRTFVLRSYVTFNEFLKLLGLENQNKEGDSLGWDDYIGESLYGYRWIDFEHLYRLTDDGLSVCEISFPFEPHRLDEEDWNMEDRVSTCGVE